MLPISIWTQPDDCWSIRPTFLRRTICSKRPKRFLVPSGFTVAYSTRAITISLS